MPPETSPPSLPDEPEPCCMALPKNCWRASLLGNLPPVCKAPKAAAKGLRKRPVLLPGTLPPDSSSVASEVSMEHSRQSTRTPRKTLRMWGGRPQSLGSVQTFWTSVASLRCIRANIPEAFHSLPTPTSWRRSLRSLFVGSSLLRMTDMLHVRRLALLLSFLRISRAGRKEDSTGLPTRLNLLSPTARTRGGLAGSNFLSFTSSRASTNDLLSFSAQKHMSLRPYASTYSTHLVNSSLACSSILPTRRMLTFLCFLSSKTQLFTSSKTPPRYMALAPMLRRPPRPVQTESFLDRL
mmetsp:Transcript_12394/g.25348  ORF Transcript_12394/g.25348 Transcript_12394/m.25348 type:complete len:295 (+) Transcript_12394:382-1266(+)